MATMINDEPGRRAWLRPWNLVLFVLFVLLAMAVATHQGSDYSVLDGGLGVEDEVRNWIGPLGARVAGGLFFYFGLAVYPLLILFFLMLMRTFVPYRRTGHGPYWSAAAMVLLGLCMLFAMNPGAFVNTTAHLGIGHDSAFSEKLVLSGGAVGAKLAAPLNDLTEHAGLVNGLLGTAGAIVIALALLLGGLILIFLRDWFPLRGLLFRPPEKVLSSHRMETDTDANSKTAVIPVQPEDPASPPWEAPAERKDAPLAEVQPRRSFWDWLTGRDLRREGQQPASTVEAPDTPYVVLRPRPDPSSRAAVNPPAEPPEIPVYSNEVKPAPEILPPSAPIGMPRPLQQTKSVDTPAGVQPGIRRAAVTEVTEHRQGQAINTANPYSDYELPSIHLLDKHPDMKSAEDMEYLEHARESLQQVLNSFSVDGHVDNIVVGPRVTRFEVTLDEGVEIAKITRIQNNIAMRMKAESLRILAPIPGRDAVGIELPNEHPQTVYIRSVMESPAWKDTKAKIPIILGRDVEGNAMVTNLAKAPHMLIAGSTGSGKSVCMNTLITSLLYRFSPADLRLILVDPKVVEMAAYTTIPHLITPVVNDPKKVPLALRWAVKEMDHRYTIMAKVKAKDLLTFNSRPQDPEELFDDDGKPIPQHLPYLIVIIDELADIMMTEAKKDVENSICRIAQKGRAAGVHLVIATQTPRKDVVTGLIKANLPVKIAFKVGNNMDSRVILDQGGAEKLLGMGDLLFNPPGAANLERIQMTLVTDAEIQKVVDFVSSQVEQSFNTEVLEENVEVRTGAEDNPDESESPARGGRSSRDDTDDNFDDEPPARDVGDEVVSRVAEKYLRPGDPPLLTQALEIVINEQQASISLFQRRLGIGYNKSAELVDLLEKRNIISAPLGGGQKRRILITDGLETAE